MATIDKLLTHASYFFQTHVLLKEQSEGGLDGAKNPC